LKKQKKCFTDRDELGAVAVAIFVIILFAESELEVTFSVTFFLFYQVFFGKDLFLTEDIYINGSCVGADSA
jgi:hypothetical protein